MYNIERATTLAILEKLKILMWYPGKRVFFKNITDAFFKYL